MSRRLLLMFAVLFLVATMHVLAFQAPKRQNAAAPLDDLDDDEKDDYDRLKDDEDDHHAHHQHHQHEHDDEDDDHDHRDHGHHHHHHHNDRQQQQQERGGKHSGKNRNRKQQAQPQSASGNAGVFQYMIQHSLDGSDNFVDRNTVELSFTQVGRLASVSVAPHRLSADEAAKFRKFAANNAFYRLRFVPVQGAGSSAAAAASGGDGQARAAGGAAAAANVRTPSEPVLASIRACSLQDGGFVELFTFHCDVYGALLSVDYATHGQRSRCRPQNKDSNTSPITLRATGRVSMGHISEAPKTNFRVEGAAPSAAAGAAGGAQGTEGGAQGGKEKEEEKGFLAKYWMYLLPFVIMMLMAGGSPQQEGGPEAGGGAASAAGGGGGGR